MNVQPRGLIRFAAYQIPNATAQQSADSVQVNPSQVNKTQPSLAPAITTQNNQASPAAGAASVNAAQATGETAAGEPPPILISVGPGGLITACEDKKALDDFELLLKTLASRQTTNQREYTIFYLKYAKAQGVAELLEQIFSTGPASSAGGGGLSNLAGNMFGGGFGGNLMGDLLFGGGGGEEAPTKLTGSGTISIVPDSRLNALFVQANPTDLDTMEQLLKVIDQSHSPEDVLLVRRPRLIPVNFTSAEDIATVVRQVYADRISGGAGGGNAQRQPSPQELIQALRGGGNRRNDQRTRARSRST